VTDLRRQWDAFAEANKKRMAHHEDDLWCQFKAQHEFDPTAFSKRPPWCAAGARNNPWAKEVFLGDGKREAAWAFLGYLDQPFDFAYLWLDYAGFNGLLPKGKLPYTVVTTRAEIKRRADLLQKAFRKLSKEVAAWPFRDVLEVGKLIQTTDYRNSFTIPETASRFTEEQVHISTRLMSAGARQEILIAMGGKGSLLERAADALKAWRPPPSWVDRPNRSGTRQRFATRWLDRMLSNVGGEMPSTARYQLIAELVQALTDLGGWPEVSWTEERVRRCLDGKSRRTEGDSV
jgi:hypothetical protein